MYVFELGTLRLPSVCSTIELRLSPWQKQNVSDFMTRRSALLCVRICVLKTLCYICLDTDHLNQNKLYLLQNTYPIFFDLLMVMIKTVIQYTDDDTLSGVPLPRIADVDVETRYAFCVTVVYLGGN